MKYKLVEGIVTKHLKISVPDELVRNMIAEYRYPSQKILQYITANNLPEDFQIALFVDYRLKQYGTECDTQHLKVYLYSLSEAVLALAKQLFDKADNLNSDGLTIELLNHYGLSLNAIDGYRNSGLHIANLNYTEDEKLPALVRIAADSRCEIPKKIDTLIQELKEFNVKNADVVKYISSGRLKEEVKGVQEVKLVHNYKALRANLSLTEENLPEVIGVVAQSADHLIRAVQITPLLLFMKFHGLAQIDTGKGKPLIISVMTVLHVLKNKRVDIVNTSSPLAVRDSQQMSRFYSTFGITTANVFSCAKGRCFKADILYGDASRFVEDVLRNISANVRHDRGFEIFIVYEVDNLFITSARMSVQVRERIPGLEHFYPRTTAVYRYLLSSASFIEEKDDKCYLRNKDELIYEQSSKNLLTLKFEEFIVKLGHQTSPQFIDFDRTTVKKHVDAGMTALVYQEKYEYVVNGGNISPVDFENTGTIQSLQWQNGLHQFLQLKPSLALTPEIPLSVMLSYFGFNSKYKGHIYGLTGALGEKMHHHFLKEKYQVGIIILASFIKKNNLEFSPIIVFSREEQYYFILSTLYTQVLGKRASLIITKIIGEVGYLYEPMLD
jgi:hypothetical protein